MLYLPNKICYKDIHNTKKGPQNERLFEPDFVRKNNINLHTFRHTYAHNMLNKGVPKEVLQTLLGHRSIKTTEIYANWIRKEELDRWV
jgi:integrase